MSSRLKPLTALDVQRLAGTAFVGGAPGLQCVVSLNGTKSWRLFYRLPGSTTRRSMTLGRYPGVSLADARRLAHEKLARASDGADPKAERAARVEARHLTVAEAASRYLDWCLTNNAPRTAESKRSAFQVHLLPGFGRRALIDLSRRSLADLLDSLGDTPAMRRQLYLYLTHFLSWCAERDLVPLNPLRDLKPPRPVAARERILTDDEIAALFAQDGVMATIAKLCLLTAQRRGSVEAMRWDQLDLARATWTIPGARMKSGKLHAVPLSAPALSILRHWPKLEGPYLFGTGSLGQRPYTGSSNGMEGLRKALGGPDWRLHDLRRTAVTLAQRQGCSLDAIRALTQHTSSGVIGVYARHAFEDEKRLVVAAIAAELAAIGAVGPA
ncbi:tyrosine-type recombinase/integrase [Hyphomonas sp.]|uniref:tyrosine-type recombinase/integrase n=1 Tax=Hyphomonas sp. TaxID=87 RepID=UPI003918ED95